MEDRSESGTISDRSCSVDRSDSRVMGGKRGSVELAEKDEIDCKRVKMKDLDGFGSDGGCSLKNEKDGDVDQFNKEGIPHIAPNSVTLNVGCSEAAKNGKYDGSLDLNSEAAIANNSSSHDSLDDAENCGKSLSLVKNPDRVGYNNCVASKAVGLDLNVQGISSSVNLHHSQNHDHIKSRDISECGSTTGSLEDNEPLRRWKEMKENGFLSASYGGSKQPTKQRVRRTKAEIIKKKVEVAKREQVDRFTKIAAPSGLLNDLNPGIINHVRNRKQVHSIIESIVRSEKLENDQCGSEQANHLISHGNELISWKESENMDDSGTSQFGFSCENNYLYTLSESEQMIVCPMPVDAAITKGKSGDDNSSMLEGVYGKSCAGDSTLLNDNDTPLLIENASENADSFSNEEPGNLSNVSSLSVKAATVASQWLELLHQDVKGRLAALRRSKKRVRAVINTELPFLISKEFSPNQEHGPCIMKGSTEEFSVNATAEMHKARWTALFNQMDHSLSEEEKQLESWLDQVKEMQLHCDKGLHHLHWNSAFGLQQLVTLENESRLGRTDNPEKELAVHAAAASIYSTCNYLLSKENRVQNLQYAEKGVATFKELPFMAAGRPGSSSIPKCNVEPGNDVTKQGAYDALGVLTLGLVSNTSTPKGKLNQLRSRPHFSSFIY